MYDAIVVGAGPAGSATAAILAQRGARVLLLDRERFPRYKACGGGIDGIAGRFLDQIDVDVEPVVQDVVSELCVTYQGLSPTAYSFARPLARMVMRSEFDALLASAAAERGAEFHDGQKVSRIEDDGRQITVSTETGEYRGSALVGADGVYSLVARIFGLNRHPILYFLTELELAPAEEVQASWAGRSLVDISVWPLGYGWVFPKRSHLSVGSGVPKRCAKDLDSCLERFLRRLNLSEGRVQTARTHGIGFRRKGAPLASDRVLLVGDAGGLADPNTGGGIGWALQSAGFAAEAIMAYLNGNSPSLRPYTVQIDKTLGWQFHLARLIRNSIVLRFALLQGKATGHRTLWREVVRVIQGEEEYSEWYAHSPMAKFLAWTSRIGL